MDALVAWDKQAAMTFERRRDYVWARDLQARKLHNSGTCMPHTGRPANCFIKGVRSASLHLADAIGSQPAEITARQNKRGSFIRARSGRGS